MRTEQRWLRIIYTIFPRISCKRIPILWGKGTQKSILKSKEQVMSTCLAPNSLSSLWTETPWFNQVLAFQNKFQAQQSLFVLFCHILEYRGIIWRAFSFEDRTTSRNSDIQSTKVQSYQEFVLSCDFLCVLLLFLILSFKR